MFVWSLFICWFCIVCVCCFLGCFIASVILAVSFDFSLFDCDSAFDLSLLFWDSCVLWLFYGCALLRGCFVGLVCVLVMSVCMLFVLVVALSWFVAFDSCVGDCFRLRFDFGGLWIVFIVVVCSFDAYFLLIWFVACLFLGLLIYCCLLAVFVLRFAGIRLLFDGCGFCVWLVGCCL